MSRKPGQPQGAQQEEVAKLLAEQKRLGSSRSTPPASPSRRESGRNATPPAEERKRQAQARLAKLKADAEAAEMMRLEAEVAAEEARLAQVRLREEREAREKQEREAREAREEEKRQQLEQQQQAYGYGQGGHRGQAEPLGQQQQAYGYGQGGHRGQADPLGRQPYGHGHGPGQPAHQPTVQTNSARRQSQPGYEAFGESGTRQCPAAAALPDSSLNSQSTVAAAAARGTRATARAWLRRRLRRLGSIRTRP